MTLYLWINLCIYAMYFCASYCERWRCTYLHFHLLFSTFWATVCKTVRPMLSDIGPLSVLSVLSCPVLSVKFVHCDKKLGKQVGLGHGHIVLDGHPPHPIFGPYLLRPNACMDQDATNWYGARPRPRRLCVRWEPRCPSPKGGRSRPPKFSAHVYCGQTAGWMKLVLAWR